MFYVSGVPTREEDDVDKFIHESTVGTVNKILKEEAAELSNSLSEPVKELGPNIASMGLANSLDDVTDTTSNNTAVEFDMSLDDIDDAELDSYIMNEDEFQYKNGLWHKLNAEYLDQLKGKQSLFY
ncbi:brf1-like tbp-binding domain [Holotrichia oblita]|uniref:Brf1-like tbp-binding domain n=1 Tax=Holotrichia oblita TaxID=644536 RepID=A0ACB9TQ80_HOLOL|nr:brf1-like tbp-binding domain [Holotrichia oblita]